MATAYKISKPTEGSEARMLMPPPFPRSSDMARLRSAKTGTKPVKSEAAKTAEKEKSEDRLRSALYWTGHIISMGSYLLLAYAIYDFFFVSSTPWVITAFEWLGTLALGSTLVLCSDKGSYEKNKQNRIKKKAEEARLRSLQRASYSPSSS